MGKLTISMAIFHSKLLVYQGVPVYIFFSQWSQSSQSSQSNDSELKMVMFGRSQTLFSYRTRNFPGDIAMIIFPSETQNLEHVFFEHGDHIDKPSRIGGCK
jgi:hypothetical protein